MFFGPDPFSVTVSITGDVFLPLVEAKSSS
jgi:hypothetical protein